MEGYSKEDIDLLFVLEKLYVINHANFYNLSYINFKKLIPQIVIRKSLKQAYDYARELPDDEVRKRIISEFELTEQAVTPQNKLTHKQWQEIYNRLFEIINVNDTSTYFSGPRFVNAVGE